MTGSTGATAATMQGSDGSETSTGATGELPTTGDTGSTTAAPCGVPVTLKIDAPSVMLVVDKSGSMVADPAGFWDHDGDPETAVISRWQSLHTALAATLTTFDHSLRPGLVLFPSLAAKADYTPAASIVVAEVSHPRVGRPGCIPCCCDSASVSPPPGCMRSLPPVVPRVRRSSQPDVHAAYSTWAYRIAPLPRTPSSWRSPGRVEDRARVGAADVWRGQDTTAHVEHKMVDARPPRVYLSCPASGISSALRADIATSRRLPLAVSLARTLPFPAGADRVTPLPRYPATPLPRRYYGKRTREIVGEEPKRAHDECRKGSAEAKLRFWQC